MGAQASTFNGITKALNSLQSNKAINALGGIFDSIDNIKGAQSFKDVTDAISKAHHAGNDASKGWDIARIAGSTIGVSSAARLISGGGLYRDRNGNTNVIGVPFV